MELIEIYDQNKNGVEFHEQIDMMYHGKEMKRTKKRTIPATRLLELVRTQRRIDVDGDGSLSPAEVKKGLSGLFTPLEILRIILFVDADHNWDQSPEEFIEVLLPRGQKADPRHMEICLTQFNQLKYLSDAHVNKLGLEKIVELSDAFETVKNDTNEEHINSDELVRAFTLIRGDDIGFVTVTQSKLSIKDYIVCQIHYLKEQESNNF